MTNDEVRSLLVKEAFAPVLLHKLAMADNIRPADEQEAFQLIDMGLQLVQANEEQRVKQAMAPTGFIQDSAAHLSSILNQNGYSTASPVSQAEEAFIKASAAELGKSEPLRKAAEAWNSIISQQAAA